MDKGAHFHNCDFQVHSPRDINWSGDRAIAEEDRKKYSEEFIKACREKKLDAVAITDHHDTVFFKYIKEASNNETNNNGEPLEEDEKVIVFPGIELSLADPPCQVILILDSDFPEEHLHHILIKLSLTPTPAEDYKTANTEKISGNIVKGLPGLYEMLDSMAEVNGKYIILPNISEGGSHTLLRSGYAEYYKNMPCVGGYLDGNIAQLGRGNTDITNGKDKNYGNKSLGVFQTSDNRQRDFEKLGSASTWAKWAEPTAEAIRQACLARESRIEQQLPELPAIFISELNVSNSKFLGPINVQFNRQYNGLIGGRGTGKSSLLEYLRWGLCDQTVDTLEDDEMAPFQNRRKSLVDKTLKKFEGEVVIVLEVNDIQHIVKRSSVDHSVQIRIGDGVFEKTTEATIRTLLPIQAYSQKQLSSVGVKIEELRRIIESPVRKKLQDISVQIGNVSNQIKGSYNQLASKKKAEGDKARYETEVNSLARQIQEVRLALADSDASTYSIMSEKKAVLNEESALITKWDSQLIIVKQRIEDLMYQLQLFPISKVGGDMHTNNEAV